MKKCRIVERTYLDGRIEYVIQQRHFLFSWWWVDAWINEGVECTDSFSSLEEAQNNLCYFNKSKCKNKIINNKIQQTTIQERLNAI